MIKLKRYELNVDLGASLLCLEIYCLERVGLGATVRFNESRDVPIDDQYIMVYVHTMPIHSMVEPRGRGKRRGREIYREKGARVSGLTRKRVRADMEREVSAKSYARG